MFSLARSLQKNGYKTALLSNAEVPAMKLFYQQEYHMFNLTVFSCIEGAVKPERKIYELTLKRLQVGASESVLIDDRQSNIDGAKQVGLNTILFEGIGQTEGELRRLGVKIT
jgi:HAD superfamily hydrolase (TIGR01509 family)